MRNKYNCYISKLLSMLGLVNCLLLGVCYIVQCGAQLMFGSFVVVFSSLLGSILQCDVQLSWVEFCIVVHVRNKSNLAALNT